MSEQDSSTEMYDLQKSLQAKHQQKDKVKSWGCVFNKARTKKNEWCLSLAYYGYEHIQFIN